MGLDLARRRRDGLEAGPATWGVEAKAPAICSRLVVPTKSPVPVEFAYGPGVLAASVGSRSAGDVIRSNRVLRVECRDGLTVGLLNGDRYSQ